MKTITFYSYKGGVGRTLLVANFARYLARFDKTVALIDLDLEAPGLHHKLGVTSSEAGRSPIRAGVTDFLCDFRDGGHTPGCPSLESFPSVGDYAIQVDSSPSRGKIWLFPAGNVSSNEYWQRLGSLDWHQFFFSQSGLGVEAFQHLKKGIEQEFAPDYLLIDSRTGITEVGGVATNMLPDAVVCLMLANEENMEGMRVVFHSLAHRHEVFAAQPLTIVPVISRLPAPSDDEKDHFDDEPSRVSWVREEVAAAVGDSIYDPIDVLVIHQDAAIHRGEQRIIGGECRPDESLLLRDYLKLFQALVPRNEVQQYLPQLIERARDEMFEDPNVAERELENLADYTEDPMALLELAKAYELRRYEADRVFPVALRLWGTSDSVEDPIHWRVVKQHFWAFWRHVAPQRFYHLPPSTSSKKRSFKPIEHALFLASSDGHHRAFQTLTYAFQVWSHHNQPDKELGLQLARAFGHMDSFGVERENVMHDLRHRFPEDPEVVSELLSALRMSDTPEVARREFDALPLQLKRHKAVLSERMRLPKSIPELGIEDWQGLSESLCGAEIGDVFEITPATAAEYFISLNMRNEALWYAAALLCDLLERSLSEEEWHERVRMFESVTSAGLEEDLAAELGTRLTHSDIRNLVKKLRDSKTDRRAALNLLQFSKRLGQS